ncbi:MAG: DUF1566 domain-containing protein [Gammaproteobacteria bacterium]
MSDTDKLSYLCTGQQTCHDTQGQPIDCADTGQDAEYGFGIASPVPRFEIKETLVEDRLTGLMWTQTANFAELPLSWQEALDFVQQMNIQQQSGFSDWRLPNRRELRSLLNFHSTRPALPTGHPFKDVFPGWYWTSTTAAINPAYAWYIRMDGARMFYGGKDQSYLVWPVRGKGNGILAVTGQQECYDTAGKHIECSATGQDGEHQFGRDWPQPRFVTHDGYIVDCLTGLHWYRNANLSAEPINWLDALSTVNKLNQQQKTHHWRLPNINELESLVDCSQANPALSRPVLFDDLQDTYWSSSTSMYEPDWAWVLYLNKGATGVGQKNIPHCFVWPVCSCNYSQL